MDVTLDKIAICQPEAYNPPAVLKGPIFSDFPGDPNIIMGHSFSEKVGQENHSQKET